MKNIPIPKVFRQCRQVLTNPAPLSRFAHAPSSAGACSRQSGHLGRRQAGAIPGVIFLSIGVVKLSCTCICVGRRQFRFDQGLVRRLQARATHSPLNFRGVRFRFGVLGPVLVRLPIVSRRHGTIQPRQIGIEVFGSPAADCSNYPGLQHSARIPRTRLPFLLCLYLVVSTFLSIVC